MSTPRTPRLRSAFPVSPQQSSERTKKVRPFPIHREGSSQEKHSENDVVNKEQRNQPIIPLTTIDAPTQRGYVAAFYFILLAWKFYDYFSLIAEQSNSLWLFMKWTAVDGIFLYGLPGMRIPWLEWSALTLTSLFLAHSLVNAILMFRVPVPVESWLIGIGKIFYDRELAISERRVKAASLVHNSSLILGKQIIHILPEGSAVLNSEQHPFCLGNGRSTVHLPLSINQTVPISVELLRSDLENGNVESIMLSAKEVRKLKKEADKLLPKGDTENPRLLQIPVKQTGLYKLGRVIDESNLEVQRTRSDALVVQCPSASMKPGAHHRCRGELSDFYIEVDATPPLRIDYTRTINRGDESSISLTWHPEDLDSPLLGQKSTVALVDSVEANEDVSWARSRRHKISVNETMGTSGGWQYRIDKVHDGCGNVVDYTRVSEGSSLSWSGRGRQLEQDFIVHQRPRARLQGCTIEKSLRLPTSESAYLPVHLNPAGQADTKASKHFVRYSFSPVLDDSLAENEAVIRYEAATILNDGRGPLISAPGIYRLQSVSTEYCEGEIFEPSSCMLTNPPGPDVTISSDEIPDKCAGHSVGILVSLDMVGSPPFTLYYSEQRRGGSLVHKSETINNLRHQLSFEPREAGHYTYIFNEISDSVYKRPRSLGSKGKGQKLEQDIKPTAWARFENPNTRKVACLDQKASFNVILTGEGPWSLEYDLIHGKSRQKKRLNDLESDRVTIETPVLGRGGSYSITLSSVTDRSGCKVFLDQEAKVEVRQEKPSVGFAQVDGDRSIKGIHGQKVRLPLRLSGEGPWTATYQKDGEVAIREERFTSSNAFIDATSAGLYTLQGLDDSSCPGVIDNSASHFEVIWIERPEVNLAPSDRTSGNSKLNHRQAVCEGEQDSLDLTLAGHGPYQLEYQVNGRPDHGNHFTNNKREVFASSSASISMDTAKPGSYRYSVMGVGDHFYDVPRSKTPWITVEQRVNPRPQSSFTSVGRTYSYCKEDGTGSEAIPVVLSGKAPFTLEVGIKHQASSKPEVVTFSGIQSNRYEIQVPKSSLTLGGYSVSILRVVDGNGCQRVKDRSDRDIVHVNVVDVPTITPMESRTDYCVGDRVSYSLSGTPPFNVFYSFEGTQRKAAVSTTDFRRLAERPGVFTINAISDRASTDACRARTNVTKVIHELPSVRISRGKTQEVDIHEGGEAEILFEFGGTPPFEFTYTRSTNAAKGKKSVVLETKHDVSQNHSKSVRAYEEGTYEVVAIRDRYCGVTLQGKVTGSSGQKLLT